MSLLAPLAWLPLLAIGVAIARRLTGSWARAIGGARLAAPALLAAWLLVHLFDYLARGGGALAWVGVHRGNAAATGPLADAVLRLSFAAGLVLAVATIVAARLGRRRPAVPMGLIAAAVAGLAGVLVAGTFAAGPLPFATALPLDVAAIIPALAGAIALGLAAPAERDRSSSSAATTAATAAIPPPRATRAEPAPPQRDATLRLEKRGGLGPVTITVAARGDLTPSATADELDRVWVACGGAGAAPSALRQAIAAGPDTGVLVADLPAPTEACLVDAATLALLLGEARRVLVVADEARATRDRLLERATTLGGWRAGLTAAGEGELTAAIAAGQCPALVVLEPAELAGRAIGVITADGHSWVGLIDRVILVAVDQLPPIASTHVAFGLRRLRLALDRARGRAAWLATGATGAEAASFLEHATLVHFAPVALGASATARATVHVRAGDASTELPAAATALAGLAGVEIEDALGELRGAEARVSQQPSWRGAVGLARIEDRQLAGLFRSRLQLAHALPGQAYLGLWWLDETPLSRFLLRDGALAGLAQQDELPAPRPVAGVGNPYLAAAHLEAALAEGLPDLASLRWGFGDAAVDALLAARPGLATGARRARWDADGHKVVASPVLTLGAGAWTDPRRDMITANAVEVRSSIDASVIARIDRRVAATRMYPHRVFRARGTLWQVPAGAPGATLTVSPAAAGAAPTGPELDVELTDASWQARPEQHSVGKLRFARAVATVVVHERVTGAIARGQAAAQVRYAPATATYPTEAVVVLFEHAPSRKALRHAGRLAADLAPAHVRVERDDLEIVIAADGLAGLARPALVIIDRHVGGIGLAGALDPGTVHDLLRWTWGVLFRCPCVEGCPQCTPRDVLAAGPDKVGALKLLGG